ncbi:trans-sulfuration enzyme family protein [Ferrimonas balearica]|uniref:trans-sulfuration enzyme family protein n=1 Tax=Ferrimonas balearica TaxID=44012 RepID=UPI001C99EB0A|nr:aminotransferase class I/II-fold pyridoxal phosphate-dependent enzyme [Ferrimonas balearica]MBY5993797.1 aminotransferase class I/II-fold pyridoxal phosphate-dependent enzyme [Ferrimonas balearica]
MAAFKHQSTCVIHGGHVRDEQGSLTTPLYQSATFVFPDCQTGGARFGGEQAGPIYTRLGNPTTDELERRLALLEGADEAVAFGSGMGAVSAALLTLLQAGDHLVAATGLYGCTHALITEQLPRLGIQSTQVDFSDLDAVEAAMTADTRVLFLETPVNPHLAVYDLDAIVALAKRKGVLTVVDNTFMTPLLQRPLRHGVDLVLHSATKYLNGHGDVVAGIVCGRTELMTPLRNGIRKDFGAILSPHDAWLILRGLKTLALRMERHCDNAMAVAHFLEAHPKVRKVHYPGLSSHPGHRLLGRQMSGAGGVLALELAGDFDTAMTFVNRLRLFTLAVSLGDAESLVQHPASMTHSPYSAEARAAAGIGDNLVRLAVGLEHIEDILADLKQALDELPDVGQGHTEQEALGETE